jgi:hypothetical protein
MKYLTGNLLAALYGMRPFHEHLRLDDRNNLLFLAECGIAAKGVSICN